MRDALFKRLLPCVVGSPPADSEFLAALVDGTAHEAVSAGVVHAAGLLCSLNPALPAESFGAFVAGPHQGSHRTAVAATTEVVHGALEWLLAVPAVGPAVSAALVAQAAEAAERADTLDLLRNCLANVAPLAVRQELLCGLGAALRGAPSIDSYAAAVGSVVSSISGVTVAQDTSPAALAPTCQPGHYLHHLDGCGRASEYAVRRAFLGFLHTVLGVMDGVRPGESGPAGMNYSASVTDTASVSTVDSEVLLEPDRASALLVSDSLLQGDGPSEQVRGQPSLALVSGGRLGTHGVA